MGCYWYKFQFSNESKKQFDFYQDFIDLYLYNSKALKFSLYRDSNSLTPTFYINCLEISCDEKIIQPILKNYCGIKVDIPENTYCLKLLFGKESNSNLTVTK